MHLFCVLYCFILRFLRKKNDGIKDELVTDIIDWLCVYILSLLFDKFFFRILVLIHVWKLTKVDPQERSTWRSGVRSAVCTASQ